MGDFLILFFILSILMYISLMASATNSPFGDQVKPKEFIIGLLIALVSSVFILTIKNAFGFLVIFSMLLLPPLYVFLYIPKRIEKEDEEQNRLDKIQNIIAVDESTKKKLHVFLSAIIRNINDISGVRAEDDAMLIEAINDSIDNILLEEIKPIHFSLSSVQSEKNTIFEYIDNHELSNNIIFKRLKSVFITNETTKENSNIDETARKKLRRKINEIFRYVLDMPAVKDEDNRMLEEAISHSIDEILQDADIKEFYYQDPLVQSDINLMLEHLDEHQLSNRLVVKRLKNLFGAK